MGKGAAIPYMETTCCPSAAIWMKKNGQIMWGGIDLVMGYLWYPTGVMCCHSTAWPGVNQKAHLICCQNRMNWSFWRWLGQPAQIPWTKGSRMTVVCPFDWGKAQDQLRTNSQGGTNILCWSKITSLQVPSIFVLASMSVFTSCHVCTSSSLGIECKDTLFEPLHICPTPWHWWGHNSCWLCDGVLNGGSGLKHIWFEYSCSTRETKMTTPLRGPMGVWTVQPPKKCTWWKKKGTSAKPGTIY